MTGVRIYEPLLSLKGDVLLGSSGDLCSGELMLVRQGVIFFEGLVALASVLSPLLCVVLLVNSSGFISVEF